MGSFIVDEDTTLKNFTDTHHAQASFYFTALLKAKEIKVNGKKVSADMPLSVGDTVQYFLTEKQLAKKAFHVVYEDEQVILVDKESGVNSEAVFAALSREQTAYFVHRLDRNTQGLLVFGKTEEANAELVLAFKEHRIEKTYLALCFGKFPKKTEILTAYLKKDAAGGVQIFSRSVDGAERIITEYEVLSKEKDVSLVKIRLHTGKTHQIRAHLAFIGCPIVGDMRYGNTAKNREKNKARQCLIAKELTLKTQGVLAYLNGKIFRSQFSFE
ncbi:MAG: RluA family pseudouridine synthase [Clostridia bacterium]|nr:RluA family pseudouridine synthase [Clostridia bacterium]